MAKGKFIILLLCSLLMTQTTGHWSHMAEMCSMWSGTGFVGDSEDCKIWGYCTNNLLRRSSSCRSDLLFNSQDGTCRAASEVDCKMTAEPSICKKMPDGALVGIPDNCQQYLLCQNGTGIEMNCPARQFFNYQAGKCQLGRPDYCEPVIIGVENSNNNNIEKHQPPATDHTICQAGNSGVTYYSDYTTCYGYYLCESPEAVAQWRSCPLGTQFDPQKMRCVSPVSYACPYDRCGNLDLTFVTQLNTDCKGYTYCVDQVNRASSTCKNPAYPYFDEINGYCVPEKPAYAICQ